jgi:hypothetical protein
VKPSLHLCGALGVRRSTSFRTYAVPLQVSEALAEEMASLKKNLHLVNDELSRECYTSPT